MAPLGETDTPYIEGRIVNFDKLRGKFDSRTNNQILAGFFGKGLDGKRYGTGRLDVSSKSSSIFENGPQGPGFRHVKLPPGEYLIFLEHSWVMLAWKKVTVKPGDRLTVDLTIDFEKFGSLKVTWPDKTPFKSNNRDLAIIPAELDGSGLIPTDFASMVYVEDGVNWIKFVLVPAGKYHVGAGFQMKDVEITPGKETSVSF
jgi:hypothetical protein